MKLLLHACCGPCSLEPTTPVGKPRGTTSPFTMRTRTSTPPRNTSTSCATLRAWAHGCGVRSAGACITGNVEACAGRIGDAAIAEVEQARAKADVEGECAGEREGETRGEQTSNNRRKPVTDTNHEAALPDGAPLSASSASSAAPRAAVLSVDPARREARCRACYRLRLEETARVAAERGFEGIGTTLSVSPYHYGCFARKSSAPRRKPGSRPCSRTSAPTTTKPRAKAASWNHAGRTSAAAASATWKQPPSLSSAGQRARKAAERAAHADERAAEEAARAAHKAERAAYDKKQARKRAILKALREQGK